jgi:hypothetical protein
MAAASRHILNNLFHFRTGRGALGSYFKKRFIAGRSQYSKCVWLFPVGHILRDCALHHTERSCLRKVSTELDLQVLLDTKKDLGTVVKFWDSLSHLLCWWFAWLEQLVEVLLSVNLWYRSTGCYVLQVSLNTWSYSWRIRRHQMIEPKIRADTATLPVS